MLENNFIPKCLKRHRKLLQAFSGRTKRKGAADERANLYSKTALCMQHIHGNRRCSRKSPGANYQYHACGTGKGEIYFVTARGKNFYRELQNGKEVAITALTRYQEMIRVNGIPERVPDTRQKKWLDRIFEENQIMNNVYPGNSRYVLEVFCVKKAVIEYFNLGVHPIFRERYTIGEEAKRGGGFMVTEACIGCGKCLQVCPQGCILEKFRLKLKRKTAFTAACAARSVRYRPSKG